MTPRARSAYRALLRELPRRQLPRSQTTPLHNRIRDIFRSPTSTSTPTSTATEVFRGADAVRIQEAEQLAQYARAQRMYAMLLERYNPGTWLDEEERIRLTARRVGMELPVEAEVEGEREK